MRNIMLYSVGHFLPYSNQKVIDYLHHITTYPILPDFQPSYGPAESDASMDKLTWWLELADWYALKHQPGPNSLRAIWHRPVVGR